ncbi:DUF6167 family protein [Streptomyces sp. N2-109]|uniref:DUF6167 family protein n=1 Tax=Streptomyces gossypii TaxID=2883101 RepID=A0ABT2JL12_9ACTN|nr:DUF6167 family protein [Streptomyces gossypii]MCT2588563.1 DUF6167 family protein [Streptomyces gossypii]
MFRRAFWFSTGAAAGVWATTKVNRKLRSLTPESLGARAADKALETGQRLRGFALDVRSGMAQREDELHDVLGLNAPVEPERPGLPRPAGRPAPGAARTLPGTPVRGAAEPYDGHTGGTGNIDSTSNSKSSNNTRDRKYDRNEDH